MIFYAFSLPEYFDEDYEGKNGSRFSYCDFFCNNMSVSCRFVFSPLERWPPKDRGRRSDRLTL